MPPTGSCDAPPRSRHWWMPARRGRPRPRLRNRRATPPRPGAAAQAPCRGFAVLPLRLAGRRCQRVSGGGAAGRGASPPPPQRTPLPGAASGCARSVRCWRPERKWAARRAPGRPGAGGPLGAAVGAARSWARNSCFCPASGGRSTSAPSWGRGCSPCWRTGPARCRSGSAGAACAPLPLLGAAWSRPMLPAARRRAAPPA